jgi:peptide/nickel transport system substrate-binding protein
MLGSGAAVGRWRGAGGLALVAAVVGAALASGAPAPGPAGELRVGVARLPESLDPAATTAGTGFLVSRQLYQGLVELSGRGDVEPGLATSWSVSRDGLTWTFRLRADVQFHNGAPVTPDVVVASLSRHLSRDEPSRDAVEPWVPLLRGRNAIVREIRRGEAGTVQIQLAQPFSPLLALLAHPAFAVAVTQNDSSVPILGTGPYRVVERTPTRLVLEATTGSGEAPRVSRVTLEEIADEAAAVAELGPGGRLDVHFASSPPAWGGLGLQVLSAPTWQSGLLALRGHEGLFLHKPVRQAIALALDPALIGPALGRSARASSSYLPPGAWGARPRPPSPHDPIRARRLLTEARVTGTSLTLLAPDPSGELESGRLVEAIRLSLAVAGITVQVRQEAGDAYLAALRQGAGELALHEVALRLDDPHFGLSPLVASDAAVRGSGTNVAFYKNPLADSLLLRASQLAFRPERLRLYQRLQAQLAEDLPYIPLYVRLQWAVARPTVRDLRLEPTGRHRLDRVWIEAPAPAPPPPSTTITPPATTPPTTATPPTILPPPAAPEAPPDPDAAR